MRSLTMHCFGFNKLPWKSHDFNINLTELQQPKTLNSYKKLKTIIIVNGYKS